RAAGCGWRRSGTVCQRPPPPAGSDHRRSARGRHDEAELRPARVALGPHRRPDPPGRSLRVQTKTRLSIIVPFLNEEENIPRLYARLDAVARTLPDVMTELVLVDDGSTDGSAAAVRALPRTGPSVRLVRLSRNFGSHAALAAGASCATGDVMTFISADMQDPPEILASLLEKWREGHEIVWATGEGGGGPRATKAFAPVCHGLMRRFALSQMPPGGVDLCLVDRRVVESLGNLQERNSSIFCLLLWAGYSQCVIPYRREARKAGRSKWTLSKKVKLFIDSFVAFS